MRTKIAVILVAGLGAVSTFAQGTFGTVLLNNYDTGAGIYDTRPSIPAAAGTIVEILGGPNASSLTPIASTLPGNPTSYTITPADRNANGPGTGSFFDYGFGEVKGVAPGGTATLVARAWRDALTYDAAPVRGTVSWTQAIGTELRPLPALPAPAILMFPGLFMATNTNTIYFLVAEFPGRERWKDSYVLPLARPADIAHARALILNGPIRTNGSTQPLVSTRIASGNDGINRNYVVAGCREWSYHVTQFLGFGDILAGVFDDSPTTVEQDVESWIANHDGVMAFYNYTVVKELGPEPICLTVQTNSMGLQLRWQGVSINYLYTLQNNPSLASSNWTPVPGGPWPSKTNQWTVPLPAISNRLYRVKADLQP
jgi:hypothetical protein